jgi:hypothetical protein
MFPKTITLVLVVSCLNVQAFSQDYSRQQNIAYSMNSFFNFANNPNLQINSMNHIPYQHHTIYSVVYDIDGKEYMSIKQERNKRIARLMRLGVPYENIQQMNLFP